MEKQRKKYTVYGVSKEAGDNEFTSPKMTEKKAVKLAKEWAEDEEMYYVFIGYYDGDSKLAGYLNNDGHSPNGKAW
jgi:hypothetical protein